MMMANRVQRRALDFFATPLRRKILFFSLYLSEGAPIGYIWLALPTRLRAQDVPIEQITRLTALLVLPWTFKFVWAPLIDLWRGRHWTLRHWIVAAQSVMGATLLPLIWLDPQKSLNTLAGLLLLHALAAATQDVAIDALCIAATDPAERGRYNGWMQAGMLLGRALMGGGALVMAAVMSDAGVVVILVALTTFSMALVAMSRTPHEHRSPAPALDRWIRLRRSVLRAAHNRNTWLGLLFAATGGAAFKSLEVIYGPWLVDRGLEQTTIGWFSMGPMIGAMIAGSLLGGWLTDGVGAKKSIAGALIAMSTSIAGLAVSDGLLNGTALESPPPWRAAVLLAWLIVTAFGIGVFTSSSYALFMNISQPEVAATQFSAFMGATNACESWSSFVAGRMIPALGYAQAMGTMSLIALAALPALFSLRLEGSQVRRRP